ncbi:exocyst complex component exo84 [Purpureocillium lavendulum]|uniref:Exocyst complex component exo84 n=1 Tax=Purpureocillium lavendulum TaxID=1247861 RepID=A0AB34FZC1_9HYPO|nr:exocyst complex component exo84 [Purpureocillium lavendulum]
MDLQGNLSAEKDDPAEESYEPGGDLRTEDNDYVPETSSESDVSEYVGSDSDDFDENREEVALVDDAGQRSSLKRPAESIPAFRPFKRQKGTINFEYLELLNRDIDDAAHRACLDDDIDLPPTQIGLTLWSPLEKRQFFEALSRSGRHSAPRIAAHINSKSVIEVQHYIDFLQDADQRRRQFDRRSILATAEYPAAVELSQQCCHAQEEAADAVSLRQEQRESQREEEKWGAYWDVTPDIALKLDRGESPDSTQLPPFSQLFHTSRWLRLSQRLFMNSTVPNSNWHHIDDALPSMWATAFDDFHSLAVSVTRRLVQATLFISMSRIRAKRELVPKTRSFVRRKDAEAAIASLGMLSNSRHMWMKSARRLRLDVFEEPPDRNEEDEQEPMSYDEVERLLGDGVEAGEDAEATTGRLVYKHESASEDEEDEEEVSPENAEERDIDREANELLWYSAADLRDVTGARQALKLRIATERHQEEQADRADEYASCQAEMEMWEVVLQKKPPMEIPRIQDPGRPERSNRDVESIYPVRRDWTTQLQYRSEWEAQQE